LLLPEGVKNSMIEQFHFIRPEWLFALVLPGLALWLLRRRGYDSGNWRAVIDARLLPYVLSSNGSRHGNRLPWILGVVATLAIVALAGPTWEKQQQAMYQQRSALVVALDLSRSMDATDIRPSRLARARHKIADILNLRNEGQSALVVYAADAFAVTPLTTDVKTILALLPDLETGLMPAQGTRADHALERALELLDNSAVAQGDVLLVTDGISDMELLRLEALLEQHPGQRVSVLAIGTPDGGPVPLSSGDFLKDRQGAIVITRLLAANLRQVAGIGGGAYATISTDDIDINTLNYVMESRIDDSAAQKSDRSADRWRELGPFLLLFALPLAALAFRRGLIWLAPLFLLLMPPDADALDWSSLWQNSDQRGMQLYQQGDHQQAAEIFSDPSWQSAAKYRAGDFSAAAEGWQQQDGETATYNHATALARQGQYEEALAAYDRLLEQSPDHHDARFNRQAIEDWLKQQEQQQQDSQQDSQQEKADESDASEQQEQQSSDDSDGESSASEQNPGEEGTGNSQSDELSEKSRQGGQADRQDSDTEQPVSDQAEDEPQDAESAEEAQAAQPEESDPAGSEGQADSETEARLDQQMSDQAAQQWLRKIPDDPGGLLRRKFLYQYRQRGDLDREVESW
jgi:Ca-activated chloride channel family protein